MFVLPALFLRSRLRNYFWGMTVTTRGSVNYRFLQRNSLQRVWESIEACGWRNFVAQITSESLSERWLVEQPRGTKCEEKMKKERRSGRPEVISRLCLLCFSLRKLEVLLRINPIPKATKASETVMGEGREGGFICTYLSNLGQNVFGCSIPTSSQSFWNCDTLSRVSYTCER